jgi:hypothetical protein
MKKEKERKRSVGIFIENHILYIKSGIHIFVSQPTFGYYDHGFHVTGFIIQIYTKISN